MVMANETAKLWLPEELHGSGDGGGAKAIDLPAAMEMDELWSLISEQGFDLCQNRQEDSVPKFFPQDSWTGVLDDSHHPEEKALLLGSQVPSSSGSQFDWMQIQNDGQFFSDKENAVLSATSYMPEDRLTQGHMIAQNYMSVPVTSNVVESSRMELGMPSYAESQSQLRSSHITDLFDQSWGQVFLAGSTSSESDFGVFSHNSDTMFNVKPEELGPSTWDASSYNICNGEDLTRRTNKGVIDEFVNMRDINANCHRVCESELRYAGIGNIESNFNAGAQVQGWEYSPAYMFSENQEVCTEYRKDVNFCSKPFSGADSFIFSQQANPFYQSGKSHLIYRKDENEGVSCESGYPHNHPNLFDKTTEKPILVNDCSLNSQVGMQNQRIKRGLKCAKSENRRGMQKSKRSGVLAISHQSAGTSFAGRTCTATGDDDLRILEDVSASAQPNPCVSDGNLQDLSHQRSEDKRPKDILAVPLLSHQEIAVAWMAKKETKNTRCSGGILADDQGLGKTISTIALILKERSPSVRVSAAITKQMETEMLNLDDEDDDVAAPSDATESNIDSNSYQANGCSVSVKSPVKGRAAAGTLIVCPTSVLRQWSEELHNKVERDANLSVLVYHGCNRTKDPFELAKYDVVLTTYSIVSMEVPKQPLVDDDDDETRKQTSNVLNGMSSRKKRKSSPDSAKKSPKVKKGTDGELVDPLSRPLGRVAWFRVVLDEAQSIKNHKTQVARACWSLRAKRRWCLSGTPIQNAIDDLYSYFRFLRFEPFSEYKVFCSALKVPIQKNPKIGYRKLQSVLRNVMLRRTKGSRIDGQPILDLPPKRIELKKVEFTPEERDFYRRLEADSRAQFAKYAAAGTVKQNYINILLMLLRLRQACDHPLLVGGFSSSSVWKSSIEMAKKLPQEKRISLLNCLEASLAICGICNDPPEDAVVTICGHVFCNQCIREHLTGDNTHCPATDCKTELKLSFLFSKRILTDFVSDRPSLSNTPNHTGPESGETCQQSFGSSYNSTKIRAALEVLKSLSKPQDRLPTVKDEGSCKSEPCSSGVSHVNMNSNSNGNSKNSPKVAGEKALVFSQWTGMLDLVECSLKESSIQYRRLDGTMSVVARDKAVKDFNTIPEVTVLIMSLKAASLGLNLVSACHVILLDLWWNPTTEDQAIDRAHRIGQTRPVTVLRLTVKDTVEDRILALQKRKREMVSAAFGNDENGGQQARLTVEDLEYLFQT